MPRRLFAFVCLLLCGSTVGWSEKDKKGENPNTRMVQGTVADPEGNGLSGAVVQLKNTKNLQIRSFITKEGGAYYFHNLDANTDYELKAERDGKKSPVRTLSAFDSRRQPIINLKLP